MKPTDFSYKLSNYLSKYLPSQLGVSTNTIKSYRDTFSIFLYFCRDAKGIYPEQLMLKDFTKEFIEEFLQWIEIERNCGISTRNQRLSAIHAFSRYLQYECPERMEVLQSILSIPPKKQASKSFDYLTLESVQVILQQPDQSKKIGFRDLVLLTLLYDSGARVQEIVDLRICDLRLEHPATIRVTGKGNKTRIVPLMERTAEMMGKYLQHCHSHADYAQSVPLFQNNKNEKLSRSGVSYIVDKYATMAKVVKPTEMPEKVTPHTFRHSKAMHLLQSGVNLIYIRDILGHSDIKTTEIYARADSKMKREALIHANHPESQIAKPSWQENSDLLSWLQNLGR